MGSVAESYKDILLAVAYGFGVTISQIVESPMQGLVDYHNPGL
jgi:hypothetical protein